MFAGYTILFYTNSNIKKFLSTVNEELARINQWLTSSKLSLNAEKTKYSFFHKPSKLCYQSSLSVIMLYERQEFIKYLRVLLGKNLNWKDDIKYAEEKIDKNYTDYFLRPELL